MGCICSKESNIEDCAGDTENEKEKSKSSVKVASSKTGDIVVGLGDSSCDESVQTMSKPVVPATMSSVPDTEDEKEKKTRIVERSKCGLHHRRATMDVVMNGRESTTLSQIVSMPNGNAGEQVAAGWPSWLTSVAGEAIQGWLPRSADSFEKLDKIGQGTYSTVYRARDLKTTKVVAMKKVRFVNMDPESVHFMAREILILRKLDHPNVMKLECIVTSRMSGSLYLVFEYMEHDLAGLAASPKIKFTEPQIKCYVQQLLHGLEHCHSRGILHRDIKGSNLLVDNDGNLKIGDFGLANFFKRNQKHPLTSHVVTLWYRAPELLLGATDYDVAIDLWSVGCILAELFVGKPIMPGRTEVEQMHKIFKLCGSPSEEYWRKSKLPHATSFKPQHPYKRCVAETFKDFPSSALALIDVLLAVEPEHRGTASSALNSEFFKTKPFPCDPSSLPKYPPSKEIDAKLQQEAARRKKSEYVKGRGPESVRGPRVGKEVTPEFDAQGQGQSNSKFTSIKFYPLEDGISGFPIDPLRGGGRNGLTQSNSMLHPNALGSSWTRKAKDDDTGNIYPYPSGKGPDLRIRTTNIPQQALGSSRANSKMDERMNAKEITGYSPNRRIIHYSGPLMPFGGNMEDMLREHERQIQEAVRKARLDKAKT